MSEAAVSEFFDKLENDQALASEYSAEVSNAILPAILKVAARHGYEFTAQEMAKHLKDKPRELSTQELESISAAGPSSLSSLTNPWVLGGLVATAIAVPLALDDEDAGS